MITTQAACCLISSKPGVAHSTTLGARLSQTVRCAECEAEYAVDYEPSDMGRTMDFERQLLSVAQQKVNASHQHGHDPIISIFGI
jgi:hypothetical protein